MAKRKKRKSIINCVLQPKRNIGWRVDELTKSTPTFDMLFSIQGDVNMINEMVKEGKCFLPLNS
jgi:hypothetical protein